MRTFIFAVAIVLAACGQAAAPSGEAAAQGGASAAGGGGQAAFVEACIARYVAQSAEARRWAPDQCVQDWQLVVAAGPLADAILATAAGTPPRAGRFGSNIDVVIDRAAHMVTFSWGASGELIPYDAVGALQERGAAVDMIGCSQLGTGEFNKAYRVTPANGAPFQLGIYARTAPTANADSFYNATVMTNGRVRTIAQLRSDGMEWSAACAY